MAQTAAAVQTQLGDLFTDAKIHISTIDGTKQNWYVVGNYDSVGRARWCTTTASDSAATQAASILTQLRA